MNAEYWKELPGDGVPLEFHPLIERLRGITGFVTTLSTSNDPRAAIFNRLEHIQRVSWIARKLAVSQSQYESASRMIWLHDVNRWPFAHNSEKGWYDQGADIGRFLNLYYDISAREVLQFQAFHRKDFKSLEPAGRLALVSDMLCGIIEDPLMVCAGINVDPVVVPDSYDRSLGGLYRSPDWIHEIRECCLLLHRDRDLGRFRQQFGILFGVAFGSFVDGVLGVGRLEGQDRERIFSEVYSISAALKEEFLRPVIFPINNELVCHSSWIRGQLVAPWAAKLGFEAFCSKMLSIDEPGFVDQIVEVDDFRSIDLGPVYPALDYMADSNHEMAFVKASDLYH